MALPSTSEPRPARTQRPHLRIANGPESGKLIWLDFRMLGEKPLVIGRQPGDADITLPSPLNRLSNYQASLQFRKEDEMLVLTDLGTTWGTRLNGSYLAGPVPLVPGDVINCADVDLIFVAPAAPAPPLPPGPRFMEDTFPEMARLDLVKSPVPTLRPGAFSRLTVKHPFLLGRHSNCDIKLLEEGEAGKEVSRRHAEIRWSDNGYLIRPLSVNPCWVNEKIITEPHYLHEGDIIRIRATELQYRAPRLTKAAPAPGNRATPTALQNFILHYSGRQALHLGSPNIVLPKEAIVNIGRSKDNLLCLSDPSVSRHHAEIRPSGPAYVLRDLSSANGTRLNGKRIEDAVVLQPGDKLQFGEFEFVFEDTERLSAQAAHPIEPPVPLNTQVRLELDIPKAPNPLDTLDHNDRAFLSADLKGYSRILTSFPDAVSRSLPEYVSSAFPVVERLPDLKKLLSEVDQARPFDEIVKKVGEEILINGNQPFLIDNPDRAWLVNEGRVEIFAVQVIKGEAINSRHHVCTLDAGEAFFGIDSNIYGEGLGLLAVGTVGTVLTKLTVTVIQKMAEFPVLFDPVSRVVNRWVALLSADIMSGTMPTPGLVRIEEGQAVELKPLDKITPARDNYWFKLEKGEAFFLGEEEIDATPDETFFPLHANTWLQAHRQCTVRSYRLETVINNPGLWRGLELFYELFFRLKFIAIRLATYDEINRLRKKADNDRIAQETALNYMVSILEKEDYYEETPEDKASATQFFKVAQQVGQFYGINMVQPPEKDEPEGKHDILGEIARFSKVRLRQVTLETNWWQYDGGAMVGYMVDEAHPVALLPVSNHSYVVYNPADNSRTPITAAIAATISYKAYIFYRPFPEKALKAWDLVKFGARGSRNDIFITILLGILVSSLGLIVPLITGYLFDSVIPGSYSGQLLTILLALVVVAYSGMAFAITRGIAILRIESKLDTSLQSAVWDRLLSLPMTFFRDYSVGDLATRALGIDQIRTLIGSNVVTAVLSNVFGLLSFVLLFFYDGGLALVALVLTLVTLGLILGFSLLQLRYQKSLSTQQGRISGLVLQLITGIAKLKVAGAEIRAFKVWAKEFSHQRKLNYKARTIGNYQRVINSVLPILTVAALFAAIGYFNNPNFSVGTYLAFMAAFVQFLTAMIVMTVALTSILQAVPLYERARPILEALPEDQSTKLNPGDLTGSIEINHVYFRYNSNGPYTLTDVSVKIKPGQFVAFVGPSGAGKSSLFRLLLGFETPEQGTIYYDNQDLAGLNAQLVRRQIGVVLQNGKLMTGDIFSNIVGSSPFTVDDAWEAARMAGIEADIKDMPMGMFTLVSEGGTTLSGGQRQRLMIARAIVARPRIILLDEATSALDNRNQALVAQSLDNLKATRIVIAHRLSTIVNADCIYVMEAGKIVQSGTYSELAAVEGPFQQLVARQIA